MKIKYNEFGEVVSVNGITTGHHIGMPMQDALGTPETNCCYAEEIGTVTRCGNTCDDAQPTPAVTPSGDLAITENGTYDVTYKASVSVNVEGGTGGGDGEMTGIGADMYLVMEGMCMTFGEFMAVSEGLPAEYGVMFSSSMQIFVRETPPPINLRGMGADDIGMLLCVSPSNGEAYIWEKGTKWSSFANDGGIPVHGWIQKSELDALDYTDPNNMGAYFVQRTSYPMAEGTMTDLVSNAKIVGGRFDSHFELTTVDLPNAEAIGIQAFNTCESLTSVNIPKVIAIGDSAFRSCSLLDNITLPSSLICIGTSAFAGCTRLSTITFEGTVEQWNAIEKGNLWNNGVNAVFAVICTDGTVTY